MSKERIKIIRTDASHADFVALVEHLDADLAVRDGEDHPFYDQYNKIDEIKHAMVAYKDNKPIGCGALKAYEPGIVEIKRMYTTPQGRGKGVATSILAALEVWAKELSYERCILETGKKQPEAIALYKKNRYRVIPNYSPYIGVENSVCFEKRLP